MGSSRRDSSARSRVFSRAARLRLTADRGRRHAGHVRGRGRAGATEPRRGVGTAARRGHGHGPRAGRDQLERSDGVHDRTQLLPGRRGPRPGAVTSRQLLRESHVVAAVGGAPEE